MSNRSETFGRLLKGAINSIATYEGKTAPAIEEELAEKVSLAGSAFQRYKSGYLPPEPRTIEIIAEAAVQRGFLSREWLQRFLHAARYHQADKLLDQLCPIGPARPRPPRVYQNLPAPTYSQFVERKEASAEVLDGLSKRSAAVIIVGLGGNGKTSLAREIADYCLKGEGGHAMFDAAVWISDKDRPGTTNLSTVLDEVARTLDYPGFTQFEHDEKRREVEQLLRRQRVLVCIDNFETITDGALLSWLLNLPEPSKALITTREYRHEYRRGGWPVELRGMSDSEARALVYERLKVLRIERLSGEFTQVEPLIAATGGNPKAIELALGLVKYERRPLPVVVNDLYAARGELFEDLFSRAWTLLDDAARQILLVATFFPISASGEALSATADVSGFVFDRAVERLCDLALLDAQQKNLQDVPRYAQHPLVRAFTTAKFEEQATIIMAARMRWINWYIALANQVGFCWNDLERLKLLDGERDAVPEVLRWAFQYGLFAEALQLAEDSQYYFFVRGLWQANQFVNLIATQAARELGRVDSEARALANYVLVTSHQSYATDLQQQVTRLQMLVENHELPDDNVSYIHQAIAEYHKAHQNISLALAARYQSINSSLNLSPSQRINMELGLAELLMFNSDYDQAKSILLRVLRTARDLSYQRVALAAGVNLASIELTVGNIQTAKQQLLVYDQEARQNNDTITIGEIQRHYATIHKQEGDYIAAREALIEAIDIFSRMGIRRELAEVREELRRLDEMGEAPAA